MGLSNDQGSMGASNAVFPDHLEVKLYGTGRTLNVLLSEVGLKVPEIVGVGGPTQQDCNLALATTRSSASY